MMQLHPFPGTNCHAITAFTVEAARTGSQQLQLTYRLIGDLAALLIPGVSDNPAATACLWQHTCFELFFRVPDAETYEEYNFSPSLNWDHYQFGAYRQPADHTFKRAPQLAVLSHDAGQLTLQALVPLSAEGALDLSLTAIIEDINGDKTYWALAHPADKPDFHAPDSFILQI